MRKLTASIGAGFARLVHVSARGNRLEATRHRTFIASHVAGACIALLVIPVHLAVYGQPTLIEALAFAWFVSPIAIALFLSRTGLYEIAHLVSAANLAGLVTFAAILTGGTSSFLVPWMVVIPFEAALSLSRRVVLAAIGLACVGLLVLFGLDTLALLPPSRSGIAGGGLLMLAGAASAAIYAGALAITVHRVHKDSESAAREGEERYRMLAENATDMITRHSANGAVIFVSHAAENLLGLPLEELYGDGFLEHVCAADRPVFLTAISRAVHGGVASTAEFRLSGVAPDGGAGEGRAVWVEMRCRPLEPGKSNAGGPSEVVAVTRDITQRKEHERELMRMRDEAESANRAKSTFLANMSHELRTPLNAIIGFSDILSDGALGELSPERQREYSRIIRQSGQQLLKQVNDLLDMSRLETGSFEICRQPFDLARLVRTVCAKFEPEVEAAGLGMRVETPDDADEILADEMACRQILTNLLSNAVKFSKRGGTIRVVARIDDDQAILSVEDTGVGIAPEALKRLGMPFVVAENPYSRRHEGAGLGLSVAQGLARIQGGRLDVESEFGRGTCVTVRLPREPGESEDGDCASSVVPLKRSA